MLFACPSVYKKEIPDDILTAHRDWLKEVVNRGVVVSAGRRVPPVGGMIILRAEDEAEALALLSDDPFVVEGIAEYEPMGFAPTVGNLKG